MSRPAGRGIESSSRHCSFHVKRHPQEVRSPSPTQARPHTHRTGRTGARLTAWLSDCATTTAGTPIAVAHSNPGRVLSPALFHVEHDHAYVHHSRSPPERSPVCTDEAPSPFQSVHAVKPSSSGQRRRSRTPARARSNSGPSSSSSPDLDLDLDLDLTRTRTRSQTRGRSALDRELREPPDPRTVRPRVRHLAGGRHRTDNGSNWSTGTRAQTPVCIPVMRRTTAPNEHPQPGLTLHPIHGHSHIYLACYTRSVLTTVLAALSDPTRRAILDVLGHEERAVGDIVTALGLGQPAVSRHLKLLREAGLVHVRPDAQRRLYSVCLDAFEDLAQWIANLTAPHPRTTRSSNVSSTLD